MDVDVEALFVGAGCNRTVKAGAWGPGGLVAFGVHSSIAIYSPELANILNTLSGHKDHVNCVEWLRQNIFEDQGDFYLLSGSADGDIILWRLDASNGMWQLATQMRGAHGKAVTCMDSIMLSLTEGLFTSTGSDGTVRIWSVLLTGDCTITLLQVIDVAPRLMVAASLSSLPTRSKNQVVLAMGGLDNHVHLYVGGWHGEFIFCCHLKAHQDWIRGLDFSKPVLENEIESLYLASCSQDRNIRIWKLAPAAFATNASSLRGFIQGPVLRVGEETWQISLEALLVGHEDWVYSICWQPTMRGESQLMSVLSSSMDKSMMIWRPDKKSGIWMNEVSVGELSQTAFGFYGGLWSPTGDAILAHGINGSLHLWKNVNGHWLPQLVPSGHFSAVMDIAWAKTGQFLFSASHDQTTRVFACWNTGSSQTWHEIARPQIHGHDMNCLAVIGGKGNHRYVSGAEEKVARVFEAPTSFLETVACVTNEDVDREGVQVLGANMSALGLSQKPIYTQSDVVETPTDSMDPFPNAVPIALKEPPLEEQLAQNTLWPETHKLYGHGNELYSMCCSHSGEVLATSCKAQSPAVAEIWLWETSSWRPITQLRSHSLTVVQMEFSHNDEFLLSVSRDRHFSVFQRCKDEGKLSYKLLAKKMAHKRIVWTCSWSPCDRYFATGSRDSSVKIWSMAVNGEDGNVKLQTTLPTFQSSVTALAWSRFLAVGLESGLIELWSTGNAGSGLDLFCSKRLDPQLCHSASVSRLAWNNHGEGENQHRIASCGSDHTVRLFRVKWNCESGTSDHF